MGLLNLIARLSMNTSGFDTAMNRALKTTEKTGRKIGQVMGRYFGTAALLAGSIAMTRTVINEAREVKKLAEKWKLTTDQIQKIQQMAKRANVTFEEMRETAIGAAGGLAALKGEAMFSEREIHNLEKMAEVLVGLWGGIKKGIGQFSSMIAGAVSIFTRPFSSSDGSGARTIKEIDAARNPDPSTVPGMDEYERTQMLNKAYIAGTNAYLSKLSAQEKMLEIQRQITILEIQAEHSIEGKTAAITRAIEAKQVELQMLQNSPSTSTEKTRFHVDRPNVNSLQQMGAFAANNQTVTEQKKANQILTRIEKNTASGGGDIYQ